MTLINPQTRFTHDETLKHLHNFVKKNQKNYEGIRIRCVAVPKDDSWTNVITFVNAFPKNLAPKKQGSRRYRQMHLLEDWISAEALPVLTELMATGSINIDQEIVSFQSKLQFNERRQYEADNDFSALAGTLYVAEVSGGDRMITLPYESLTMPKLKHYPDGAAAVKEWMGINDFNIYSSGFRAGILVFLPERRIYFNNCSLSKSELKVVVTWDTEQMPMATVMGSWLLNMNQVEDFSSDALNEEMVFKKPKNSNRVMVQLIDENGDLFDQRTKFNSDANTAMIAAEESSDLVQVISTADVTSNIDAAIRKNVENRRRLSEIEKKLLFRLYETTGANRYAIANFEEIANHLDMNGQDAAAVEQILVDRGFIARVSFGEIGITREGIEQIEFLASGEQNVREPKVQGSPRQTPNLNPRKVFLIQGRNSKLIGKMNHFLESLGLQVMDWHEAMELTGERSPYVGIVIKEAFAAAQAIVVLMSPDDEVRLKQEFWHQDEKEHEKIMQGQSRPNVIFEFGMALGLHPEKTILVEVDGLKAFSDKTGRHVVQLSGSEWKNDLAKKLKAAGCELKQGSE
jgi:predicted nucleotide-binding protein